MHMSSAPEGLWGHLDLGITLTYMCAPALYTHKHLNAGIMTCSWHELLGACTRGKCILLMRFQGLSVSVTTRAMSHNSNAPLLTSPTTAQLTSLFHNSVTPESRACPFPHVLRTECGCLYLPATCPATEPCPNPWDYFGGGDTTLSY